jgi:tetratricopeptide (TPR) repeat protein
MYGRVRRFRGVLIIGLLLGAVFAPRAAASQDLIGGRPLVLPFRVVIDGEVPGGEGAAFWLGEAAAVLLTEDLVARGVPAFSRAERLEAFSRLQLPTSAVLTRATMIRVGELIGATDVVVGEIHMGATLSVRARMVALATAQERGTVRSDGTVAELYDVFARMATQIVPSRAVTEPEGRAPLALIAFENYVKGLVATTPAVQERFLEAAKEAAPTDDRVLLALWDMHTAEGDHEAALAAARAVPRAAPLDRHARYCAALSFIELEKYAEAYELLQALQNEAPTAAVANALGVVQLRRGSTPQTGLPTYFFTRAADQAPDNPAYLFNLGYAYARSRNTEGALYWLREGVRFDPADGDAHLVMSQVLLATGKRVEAQREFELAKQLGTSLDPATLAFGEAVPQGLERVTGRLDVQVVTRVDAAIANPAQREQQELAAFHLDRGRKLFEQEDDKGATQELRRAIYLRPYEQEPHVLLGRIYRRAGRLDEAIEAFRIAVWARDTLAGRLVLAETLWERGDRADALEQARRALALDPQSDEAKALVARMGGTPGTN